MQPTSAKALTAKLLLTVEEAAQLLSIGRTLLYDLVMRGKVDSVKIGNARRIPLAALQAYVESLKQQQAQ
ncbi:MAG: helix-turn-helix domain-containing protein [Ktedonobacterales bacterium]|nr:helix-turn-helix domain-containing protein [Ktedonobacterales bacterium]